MRFEKQVLNYLYQNQRISSELFNKALGQELSDDSDVDEHLQSFSPKEHVLRSREINSQDWDEAAAYLLGFRSFLLQL